MTLLDRQRLTTWRAGVWVVMIACASIGFSRAFACATPFAALACIAALKLGSRHAILAVAVAWAANQAIGFLLLGYPHTATTFAWGAAIGIAAIAALAAARQTFRLEMPPVLRVAVAYLSAFAAYEAVLIATAFALQSGLGAFTPAIMLRIFAINFVALALMILFHSVFVAMFRILEKGFATRAPSWV